MEPCKKNSASGQIQDIKKGGLTGSDDTHAISYNIVLSQNNLQTELKAPILAALFTSIEEFSATSPGFDSIVAATSNVAHISQTQNDASVKAKQDYNSELLRRLSALRLSVDATRCTDRQHQNRYLTTCK